MLWIINVICRPMHGTKNGYEFYRMVGNQRVYLGWGYRMPDHEAKRRGHSMGAFVVQHIPGLTPYDADKMAAAYWSYFYSLN